MEESNKDQLKLYSGKLSMVVDMKFCWLLRLSFATAIILIPCVGFFVWGFAQIINAPPASIDALAHLLKALTGH